MSMNKAVILVGGMGTRLRPITSGLPKPLVPIVGTPIIKHILGRAADFGITRAALATMYFPEKIREALGQSFCGIELNYVNEETPIGTAGGAKAAFAAISSGKSENVIILSGDGMWDFDIKAALAFHESKNADVTIVTTKTDLPTEYGIVNSAPDGKILRFAEKPTWSQVVSDKVNTGIYIMKSDVFDMIPDGKNFDFSKDLFPKLLANGNALYSFFAEGFWCDIGDAASYYKCNMEALAGRISGMDFSGAYGGEELFRAGATYRSPIWVSRLALVEKEAEIGQFSVVGAGCRLNKGCEVSASVLHDEVFVGENAKIESSIVCKNAFVGKNTVVRSGCIIGEGCHIGEGVTMCEGATLAPGTRIEDGATIKKDGDFSKNVPFDVAENGYSCREASLMLSVGQAIAHAAQKVFGNKSNREDDSPSTRIGVLREDKREAAVAAESLLCGIRLKGARGFYFGTGFEAQAHFAAGFFLCDAFVYVSECDGKTCFKVFDRMGRPVGKDFERAMNQYADPENNTSPKHIYDTEHFESISFLYYNELMHMAQRDFTSDRLKTSPILSGMKICLVGAVEVDSPKYLLNKAITELGGSVSELCEQGDSLKATSTIGKNDEEISCADLCIKLSPDGLGLEVMQDGAKYDMPHVVAMLISTAKSVSSVVSGGVIPIPFLSPKAFRKAAENVATLCEYLADGQSENSGVTREAMRNAFWVNDACFAALRLVCTLAHLSKDSEYPCTLQMLSDCIPGFSLVESTIEETVFGKDVRATVMSELSEMSGYSQGIEREREGIELVFENGHVTVIPKKTGGFRLIGEAISAEVASELCGDVTQKIMNMVKKDIKYPE